MQFVILLLIGIVNCGIIGGYVKVMDGNEFVEGISVLRPNNGTVIKNRPLFFKQSGNIIPDVEGQQCWFYTIDPTTYVERDCNTLKDTTPAAVLSLGSGNVWYFGKGGKIWMVYQADKNDMLHDGNAVGYIDETFKYVFLMDFDMSCLVEDFTVDDSQDFLYIRCKHRNLTSIPSTRNDYYENRLYEVDLTKLNVTRSYDIESDHGFYDSMQFYDNKLWGFRRIKDEGVGSFLGYFDLKDWSENDIIKVPANGETASTTSKSLLYAQMKGDKDQNMWGVFDMDTQSIVYLQPTKDAYITMMFIDFDL